MTGATSLGDPHFIETLEGSFSAVSTATIARVGAFFNEIYKICILSHLWNPKWKKPWKNHLENPLKILTRKHENTRLRSASRAKNTAPANEQVINKDESGLQS